MPITNVMRERHTVRKYLDKPLPAEVVNKLQARIDLLNQEHNVAMRLVCNDNRAFGAALRLVLAKGVQNYLVLAAQETPVFEERLGYCSADFMLFAQELGLNTWWVGGTYSKKGAAAGARAAGAEAAGTADAAQSDHKIIGVVAIGYGAVQGRPHKSKTVSEVSTYEGQAPAWFEEGVKAALLAPTAVNRQAFLVSGRGNEVSITYKKGPLSSADLGIVKYFFEIGAGAENFVWASARK